MTDLKPCPFCGGEELRPPHDDVSWPKCLNCGAEGPYLRSYRGVDGWNNRLAEERLEAALAECREAAEALDQPAWRPIAEAPMDGTPVMLAHIVDKYVLWACAAEWGTALPGYIQCASYSGWFHRLPVTTDPARGPGEFAATGDIVARDCYPPTHFMPLPTPPEDV